MLSIEGISDCEWRFTLSDGSVGAALSKPFTPIEDIRDCVDCVRFIVGLRTLAISGDVTSTLCLGGRTCSSQARASDESISDEFILGRLGSLVFGLTLRLLSRSRKLIGS